MGAIIYTGKPFWGLFRDGELYEVHKTQAAAKRAMDTYKPGSKHKWAIATVQISHD